MSVNVSSTSNQSLPHSSPSVHFPFFLLCYITTPSSYISSTYLIAQICLLLPLGVFILHHGAQKWWKRGPSSSGATVSHSDFFTYHMVIMELTGVLGCIVCLGGICKLNLTTILVGNFGFSVTWYGEILFHMFSCAERYLAVIHPMFYMTLRNDRGVQIRNITIACTWLVSIVAASCLALGIFIVIDLSLLILALSVTTFCSLRVLCILNRPGPGKQGFTKNQSKQRAFHLIVATMTVLAVKFIWNIVWELTSIWEQRQGCVLMDCGNWFNLPSSLVLPLMFVQRKGKLCQKKTCPKRRDQGRCFRQ